MPKFCILWYFRTKFNIKWLQHIFIHIFTCHWIKFAIFDLFSAKGWWLLHNYANEIIDIQTLYVSQFYFDFHYIGIRTKGIINRNPHMIWQWYLHCWFIEWWCTWQIMQIGLNHQIHFQYFDYRLMLTSIIPEVYKYNWWLKTQP